MTAFVLRNVDHDQFLDIPFGEAGELKPVELYGDCHGGENQLWQVRDGRIASVLDDGLCLGALQIRDGEPVVLVSLESDSALTWKWGSADCDFDNDDYLEVRDSIVCCQDESLRIGKAKCGSGIALQKTAQMWKKEEPPALPMDTFVLHNVDRGTFLNVPGDVREFQPVELQELHQGVEYQEWQVQDGRLLPVDGDSGLCLGARKIVEGEPVVMVPLDAESALRLRWGSSNDDNADLSTPGKYKGDAIVCVQDPNLRIGPVRGSRSGIELQKPAEHGQLWEKGEKVMSSQPATSCHLFYLGIMEEDVSDDWTLECTVNVQESADCTYFCVVGWGPGGYSGIQQINGERRVAIFSMWNDHGGCGDVKEVEHGDGVIVSKFGGEGTGFKSMKDVDWKDGEDVTLTVQGKKISSDGDEETWRCSCWFRLGAAESENEKHLMATFERRSRERPLSVDGFYSFVEDWNRDTDAAGHSSRRMAQFSKATVNGRALNEATFTKVESGDDAFAASKALGFCVQESECFVLSTGGNDVPAQECVCNNSSLRICHKK